jgi:hypothetical protein
VPYLTAIAPAAAATVTTSGVGASLDLGPATTALLTLTVSDAGGAAPTLDVSLETSEDGLVWTTLGAFPQVSGPGRWAGRFPGASRYLRARWTLGGAAPSFAFKVLGSSAIVYATPADIDARPSLSAALEQFSPAQKDVALCQASDEGNELIGDTRRQPITSWSDSWRGHIVSMAIYHLMYDRGFDSKDPTDQLIVREYDRGLKWFADVRDEKIQPTGMVDATPADVDGGASIVSRRKRRWDRSR